MEQAFKLMITSCRGGTWQGTLRPEGGEAVPFRSELELLLALARRLPPEGLPPAWEETSGR